MSELPGGPERWVRHYAERQPQSPALLAPGVELSYAALDARIDAASACFAQLGISRGDAVVLSLPLCIGAAILPLALQRLGATAIELPRELTQRQRESAFRRCGARFASVAARDHAHWALLTDGLIVLGDQWVPDAAGANRVAAWGDEYGQLTVPSREGEPAHRPSHGSSDESATLVLFTSGSTGEALGVRLSETNLASNAAAIASSLGLTSRDRAVCLLSLSYAFGRSILHSHLLVGSSVYLDPRFAFPRVVMAAVQEQECTAFYGVPMTFELLRRHVSLDSLRVPTLRLVAQAGGRLSTSTAAWTRSAFAPAPLFVMYGATEATARLTCGESREGAPAGFIGTPIAGVSLEICAEDGTPQPRGTVGQVVARGPGVALGYLDAPERAATTFREGSLWTSDIGVEHEDGSFSLVGRASELLKVGGYRCSPVEIEEELGLHPAVEECAVVAVEDDLFGVALVAVVVARAPVTLPQLRAHLATRGVPPVKHPTRLQLVAALPRTENGKLQRAKAAELLVPIAVPPIAVPSIPTPSAAVVPNTPDDHRRSE